MICLSAIPSKYVRLLKTWLMGRRGNLEHPSSYLVASHTHGWPRQFDVTPLCDTP